MKFFKIIIITIFSIVISCNKIESLGETPIKLLPFSEGKYLGYMDYNGKIIINPQFNDAFIFNEGLALVQNSEGKFGFIDEKGKFIIPPIYKEANSFSEDCALVKNEQGGLEYIDKMGKTILSLDSKFQFAGSFKESLARVTIDNKMGFINKKGEIIIQAQFDGVSSFLNNIAIYEKFEQNEYGGHIIKYGYINKKGEVIIPAQFDGATFFNNGKACVKLGENWGIIDAKGKFIVNPIYKELFLFPNTDIFTIKQGDLYGFIDNKGEIIINPQFDNAMFFDEANLVAVKSTSNNKWGYINKKGESVISPQFDEAEPFKNEIAIVKLNDKKGIIDKTGKFLVNPIYKEIKSDAFGIYKSDSFNGLIKSEIISESNSNVGYGSSNFQPSSDYDSTVEKSSPTIIDSASINEIHTKRYNNIKEQKDNTTSDAEFPGGINNLKNKIYENYDMDVVDVPENQKPIRIECRINYIVNEDGSLTHIEAVGRNQSFNNEAMRTFKSIAMKMKWKPAKYNGVVISKIYSLPLNIEFE